MKTELAQEILQSCEKLNHGGNSQKKCFIYLCVRLLVCSKTEHTRWQPRSLCATVKDLWKWSQASPEAAKPCSLLWLAAFQFHQLLDSAPALAYTWRYSSPPKRAGPWIISASQTCMKGNICLREEHRSQCSADTRRLASTHAARLQSLRSGPSCSTLTLLLAPSP